MRARTKKILLIAIIALAVVGAAVLIFISKAGVPELARFNAHSIMDWKLGDEISGISSIEDAKAYDTRHFEYFTDDNGCGIKNLSSNTRYYLGAYPQSDSDSCRIIGFSTTETYYSVMGVGVGDDELDAKTLLLESGYSLNGGGYNSCRAIDGAVHVYMSFESGTVTGIAAFLK